MKYNFFIILGLLIIFPFASGFSQNQNDAIRYSQDFYGGTARFNSMSGAFGALGGDLSSATINPAGIAVLRNTQITFTPAYFFNSSKSTFLMDNTRDEDYTNNLNINNAGFGTSFNLNNQSGWKRVNFGINYNHLRNYNRNIVAHGINDYSSKADYYVAQANKGNWQTPRDSLPNYGGLVFQDPDSKDFFSDITLDENYGLEQRKYLDSEGFKGEYTFSAGANYNNIFYIGGALGVQKVDYSRRISYHERDINDKTLYFNRFSEQHDLTVSGSGVNLKIGAIVKPTDWLRIGGAFHSPTFLGLEEESSSSMETQYVDSMGGTYEYKTRTNYFEYDLNTPQKVIGSAAFLFGKKGLISVEYEYVDYSKMRMRADQDQDAFHDVNSDITQEFTPVHNIRGGGEIRFGAISLRGGYAYYGSPYKSDQPGKDEVRHHISGGAGINSGGFFIDMAGTYMMTEKTMFFYDKPPSKDRLIGADINSTSFRFTITAGFRM